MASVFPFGGGTDPLGGPEANNSGDFGTARGTQLGPTIEWMKNRFGAQNGVDEKPVWDPDCVDEKPFWRPEWGG